MTETSHDSSGWPSIVPERDILVRARLGAEGRDDLQICGALVGGPVSPANALDGQYVAPETLFGEVAKARESGVLPGSYDEGPRAALLACIESRTSATDGTTGRDALAGALRSTMPAGEARRRVVLDAPANTSLGVLPFEGIQMSETRPFETGRAELLRYVDVPDAPARTPYAPYLRRYRALVLVGDVEQTGRVSGSLDALRGEVQAVVDALRIPGDDDVGAEVLVGSVTGSLQLRGAVERPLLLDRRGTREEREHRFRKALSRLLNASPIDVLHYIGHGEEASESKVGPQSERLSFSLPLRPEDGGRSQRVWVTGEQLAKSLRRPARLVTVSACAAAPQLAEALCGAAEHVVVMGAPVEPRFAEAWSQALYRRLFVERLPIGRAVAGARDALRAGEFEGRVWIPRHYARTLDDSAFQELPHRAFLDLQTRRLGTMEGVQQDWWLPKDEAWIDRVYVETGLSMPSPRVTDDADASDEGDGSEETLKAVVTSGPHLRGRALPHYRLIGAAGSGKTTALRVLVRRLSREGKRLPIYVRLPDWEEAGFALDFLTKGMRDVDQEVLRENGHDVVLLLDGLDEIDDVKSLRSVLFDSESSFDEMTLVIAGRSSAESLGEGFSSIELSILTHERAKRLAARVLNVEKGQAEFALDDPGSRDEARAKRLRVGEPAESAEQVVGHLATHPSLRLLAEVPLFVTLAAHMWADGVELTTGGRLDFFRQVIDFLVGGRHRDRSDRSGLVNELTVAAQALAVESIARRQQGFEHFRRRKFGKRLAQAEFARSVVDLDDVTAILDWSCERVREELLATGLLIGSATGKIRWTIQSFQEALVAEALREAALVDFKKVLGMAGDLVAARRDAASAFAETFALFALGLQSDDDRETWVRFLLEREREEELGGRLASRLLWLGVTVSDELAAEILGATGDWQERHDLYEKLDDTDAEGLVAYLGAVVRNAFDVDAAGVRSVRIRDLGYVWCRAERLEQDGRGLEELAALRRVILDQLPRRDRARLERAFGTIGGAWADSDEERERLAADRSTLAPLRDDPEHPIDAAPLDAPFWVDVGGTPADEPFAIGADPDDEYADDDETPPPGGVHLSSFAISAVPVTRGLYRLFDPTHEQTAQGRPDEPAAHLTWYEARLFCAWATHWLRHFKLLGPDESIDLPTEAQWEYAARERGLSNGGSRFHTGRDEEDLARAGWYFGSDYGQERPRLMPVGLLTPAMIEGPDEQSQQLWDCPGNVFEWCRNVYTSEIEGGNDPSGPAWQSGRGAGRVVRGGSIDDVARHCRASYRDGGDPAFVVFFIGGHGFRLVRAPSG